MSSLRSLFLATLAAALLIFHSAQSPIQNIDTSLLLPNGSTPIASLEPVTPLLAVSASVIPTNVSARPELNCLGRIYGYITLPASCQDVIANTRLDVKDETPKTWGWGRRGSGVEYDYPMPQRFVSRDGVCVIDVDLPPILYRSCQTSLADVDFAAWSLIQYCVVQNQRPQNGTIGKFGGDNRMEITVFQQQPKVRCGGDAAVEGYFESCLGIVNGMSVDNGFTTFGTGSDADVQLPYTHQSRDGKCYMTLKTTSTVTVESGWLDIWEILNDAVYMCRTQGKIGLRDAFGTGQHLSLEMGSGDPSALATL